VGKVGPKSECLAYIKEVWTDMRPFKPQEKDGRDGKGEESKSRRRLEKES